MLTLANFTKKDINGIPYWELKTLYIHPKTKNFYNATIEYRGFDEDNNKFEVKIYFIGKADQVLKKDTFNSCTIAKAYAPIRTLLEAPNKIYNLIITDGI
jgi:hypothetical protein